MQIQTYNEEKCVIQFFTRCSTKFVLDYGYIYTNG